MEEPLMLTEKSRSYFLDVLEKRYCGEMDIEGWYAFHRAMEKNDEC